MFVCNYNRKTFVVDHRQKYLEIAKDCLWIEMADERLRFLQTKHLQCTQLSIKINVLNILLVGCIFHVLKKLELFDKCSRFIEVKQVEEIILFS